MALRHRLADKSNEWVGILQQIKIKKKGGDNYLVKRHSRDVEMEFSGKKNKNKNNKWRGSLTWNYDYPSPSLSCLFKFQLM